MITFVIPIKSKAVASNWPNFSQLFERTLRSICNQTDSNFKVIAVCHEIPEINYTHEHLHFIHPDFQPPSKENTTPKEYLINQRIDKGEKIKLGVAYARKKYNTDYVMLVDSDDFVSNRIAEFVNNKGNNLPGWYIGRGYLCLKWKYFLVFTKKFNQLCGSSIIVKPSLVEHFFDKDEIEYYFDHHKTTLDSKIELKSFPFSAAIYNIGNGDNILMSFEHLKNYNNHSKGFFRQSLKRLFGKFRNYRLRLITKVLRKEFSFYTDVES